MTIRAAQTSRVLASAYPLSGVTTRWGFNWNAEMLDVTCLTNTAKVFLDGDEKSDFSVEGILDTDGSVNALNDQLTTWKATSKPVTVAPSGTTAGSEVFIASMVEGQYQTHTSKPDVVRWQLAGTTDGLADFGQSVLDLTAITANNLSAAVDGTAATTNGGIAQIHVTAYSGFTNVVVTIEHSVDGSTSWATLATFTTITNLTSERVLVATGTNVRRFLRANTAVTGAGSITFQTSFARR